jgi:pimeloyl-ACP methyl ester carboxylesterase
MSATVTDLAEALQSAGVTGPFVLVSRSYAGLEGLEFADRYRQRVAGMVGRPQRTGPVGNSACNFASAGRFDGGGPGRQLAPMAIASSTPVRGPSGWAVPIRTSV